MTFLASGSFFIVSSGLLAQSPGPDRQRGGDGQRGGGRGEWFGRFSAEDQGELYNRMVDRYAEQFTRQYELNETQQLQVKGRLQALKVQQEGYSAPFRDEMRKLGEEAREIRRARESGQPVDDARSRQIWQRFSEIRRGSPLMDFSKVTSEVESMLPAEQVEKGRARAQNEGRGFQRRGGQDAWRRYLERFADRFKLDAAQRATAESVFRTQNEQRERYRQAHKAEFAALDQIQERDERFKKQQELNQPVQTLFAELRSKLDQIPTAAQKAAAPPEPERRRSRAQTQPAVNG